MTAQQQSLPLAPEARMFIGCGEFAGWRLVLTPEAERGVPGFRRETVTSWNGWREWAQGSIARNLTLSPGYAQRLQAEVDAGKPPVEWVDEKWLEQWLKAGSIREVRP
jgi:hypothetical protein